MVDKEISKLEQLVLKRPDSNYSSPMVIIRRKDEQLTKNDDKHRENHKVLQ